jgi:hypothetical protein
MGYQVFVSYRRDGGEALACLISERLKQRGYETFYDVQSLRSGKFNEEIFRVIDMCTDVVVVLPQNGLDRCKNEQDWVRKEIAYSIKANKNIIPVMMRNFEFPQELPHDIVDLRNFNGISANMEYFDAAFTKLLSMIKASTYSSTDRIQQLTDDEELRAELLKCMDDLENNNCAATKTALADCYRKLHKKSLNEEIARLYADAANLEYAPAQHSLGDCYYYGKGVEKNIEKAFEWYKKAADQGLIEAQYDLGSCFRYNHKELEFVWMKKAAEQSHPEALYRVGECYEAGRGVVQDYDLAKQYYAKAEVKGFAAASKKTTKKYWRVKKIKDFFGGV